MALFGFGLVASVIPYLHDWLAASWTLVRSGVPNADCYLVVQSA